MNVPLFRTTAGERELDAIRNVFQSGWLGKGPQVAELERQWGDRFGGYSVAVNSCTAALELAYKALGVRAGTEVIVPTWTFCSTAHSAARLGADVRFADIDWETLCATHETVRPLIKPGVTAAIAWVGMAGDWREFQGVYDLAKEYGLPIIADMAHMPDPYGGRFDGADAMCHSLHAVKHLGCGDGGVVTFKSRRLAEWARRESWLGIDRSTHDRSEKQAYSWSYDIKSIGQKCHMNDITAAIALTQLDRLDESMSARDAIALRYCDELKHVQTPEHIVDHGWHLYIVRHHRRNNLRAYLSSVGITTGVHYQPLHGYSVYGSNDDCPIADDMFPTVLSLPMYPTMTEAEQSYVIRHVNAFTEEIYE